MIGCLLIYGILFVGISLFRKEKLPAFLTREEQKKILFILFLSNTLVLAMLLPTEIFEDSAYRIERNTYGGGTKKETYQVTIDGILDKEEITVEVGELQYTKEEVTEIFEKAMDILDATILGKNKSRDHVDQGLNLVTELEEFPVEISWELDRYDVLDREGNILQDYRNQEGTLVELRGRISYLEQEAIYVSHVYVFPEIKTGKEKWIAQIQEFIKKEEAQTKEDGYVSLPEQIEGKEIKWNKQKDRSAYLLLVLGSVFATLLPLNRIQDEKDAEKHKYDKMIREYPELLSKFTLLLSTGMTLKYTWEKIVSSYEIQKSQTGISVTYEEMKITCHEIQGGISEKEAYERFGRRCKLTSYMKFGALLSQNLKKGNKGLIEVLRTEAIQAFEERKKIARILGEEASTKLLMPMFLMLGVVFAIVVIPAFLSIQI